MAYTKSQVDEFLTQAFFSSMAWVQDGAPQNEILTFSHSVEGTFYLLSHKSPETFKGLEEPSVVALTIYKERKKLEDIEQLQVRGQGQVISDLSSPEAQAGLEVLSEKTPYAILVQKNLTNQVQSVIQINAHWMAFYRMGDIQKQTPPFILEQD